MPAGADAISAQYDDMNVHEDEENEYESFMAEESASRLGVQALLDQAALQDAQNLLTAAQQQADQLAQADQDRRDARQQQAQLAATELARQQQAAQDDHNRREARQYQAQMAAEQLAADAARQQQQQQHVQPPADNTNKRAGPDTSPSAQIRSRPRLAATNLSDDDYDDDDQLSIDFYASSKNRSDSSKKRAYPGARTRGGSTRRNTATVFSSSRSDVSGRRDVIGRTVVDLISDVDSSAKSIWAKVLSKCA
jgi:DNA segregation ATPase FtsK/SpoIIIE-like protein